VPISGYFKGSGEKVMAGMMKEYGAKKGKQVFYATAHAHGMTPASKLPKGVTQSPSGDLGQHRQVEATIAGGFTGPILSASKYFRRSR
jgi:hypothetical protein